jgi:hypothetical protein
MRDDEDEELRGGEAPETGDASGNAAEDPADPASGATEQLSDGTQIYLHEIGLEPLLTARRSSGMHAAAWAASSMRRRR